MILPKKISSIIGVKAKHVLHLVQRVAICRTILRISVRLAMRLVKLVPVALRAITVIVVV